MTDKFKATPEEQERLRLAYAKWEEIKALHGDNSPEAEAAEDEVIEALFPEDMK